jgi:Fic family protein
VLIAVEQARGALGEFIGQSRLVQNINLIMAPFQQQEAVLSSRIEGTQTEIREVLRYRAGPSPDRAPGGDLGEVLNYLDALEAGQTWVSDGRPLNLSLIRALHEELMQGVRGQDKSPGAFRTKQVYIGSREGGIELARFVPPPAEQVLPLMDDLIEFIQRTPTYGTLIDCALIHYQFEAIHPFEDGNGRIGRLLIPLFLLHAHGIDRPILYLSSYFEKNRDDYTRLLKDVSTTGAWEEWILFFMDGVKRQADDSRGRIERILNLHARYREQAATATSKAAVLAIDYIMEHVYVAVPQIAEATHTTYPTARSAVDALVALGVLRPSQRMRGRQMWVAEELLHEVYETT